ncbi:MAG: sulfurtransferase TusA family protein [Clostridiales bacterium]
MIDARGLSCPMPIVLLQKAIKKDAPAQLDILVDNQCAVENITRFAGKCGYQVIVTEEGIDSHLVLKK